MAGEYEELVETESLLNETCIAQEARYPDLKNQTVIAQEHLRFSETYQNVDFVADIVIAQGEMEDFKDRGSKLSALFFTISQFTEGILIEHE